MYGVRGTLSSFSGREDELSIDGDVSSVMLGADWSAPRWTAGALVAHSMGKGTYAGAGSGTVKSDITGLYPYGQHALSTSRLTLWGVAGYGSGTLSP